MGFNTFIKSALAAFVKSPKDARNTEATVIIGPCTFTPCSPWPPSSVDFSLGALTATKPIDGGRAGNGITTSGTGDAACCDLGFNCINQRIIGLADCLSKTFKLKFNSRGSEFSPNFCQYVYGLGCVVFADPVDSTDICVEPLTLSINAVLVIQLLKDVAGNITIHLQFDFNYLIGHNFYSQSLSTACGGFLHYEKDYTQAEFNCNGPWTLIGGTISGHGGTAISGFKNTIDFHPNYNEGGVDFALSYDCCPGLTTDRCVARTWTCVFGGFCEEKMDGTGPYKTIEECQISCPATPSWNCINGRCVDPGDGSGAYFTLSDCSANCTKAPPTFVCVNDSSCVDPGNGTGTYTDIVTCQTNCPNVDTRNKCCPDGMPDQIIAIVESGQCSDIDGVLPMSWIAAKNAYVGSYFTLTNSLRLEIACINSQWIARLFCVEALIAEGPVVMSCRFTNEGLQTILGLSTSICCNINGATVTLTIFRAGVPLP